MKKSPQLVIVGGPNGSGKKTLALEYADEVALPYIGADAIAAALNPSNPAAVQIAAARQFICSIDEHISQKKSFICESTLSRLTLQKVVTSAREAGYAISIAFLFVDSADVCVARVTERVREAAIMYLRPTFDVDSGGPFATSGKSTANWSITGCCFTMD